MALITSTKLWFLILRRGSREYLDRILLLTRST
jgi:hypothetical protein